MRPNSWPIRPLKRRFPLAADGPSSSSEPDALMDNASRVMSGILRFCVYIGDPTLLWELRACLQRIGCVAEQRRAHELEVYVPDARNEKEGRRRLDICLASWQAKNVGVEAYVQDAVPAA